MRSKAIAKQMEDLVRRIAEWGLEDPAWHGVLDAVKRKEILLPDLLKAKNEDRLDHLKRMVQDPPLSAAVAEYKRTGLPYEVENGLRLLLEMAEREFGPKPRMGELRSGKAITLLCARAERQGGRDGKPLSHNYVHRSLRNAISLLIGFHWGMAERDRIFADVRFSAEDDTRDVWLNAEQLAKLLEACEPWLRPFVLVAAATGADRAPLLRLRVRDVQIVYRQDLGLRVATIYLQDKKNDARPRSVAVVGPVAEALFQLAEGKAADKAVFHAWFDETTGRHLPLTKDRVRAAFERARSAAGFTKAAGFADDLRFKDLRHTAGVAFEQAGFSVTEIGAGLGHKRRETSLKYTKRQITLGADDALRVARQLGLVPGEAGEESKLRKAN